MASTSMASKRYRGFHIHLRWVTMKSIQMKAQESQFMTEEMRNYTIIRFQEWQIVQALLFNQVKFTFTIMISGQSVVGMDFG